MAREVLDREINAISVEARAQRGGLLKQLRRQRPHLLVTRKLLLGQQGDVNAHKEVPVDLSLGPLGRGLTCVLWHMTALAGLVLLGVRATLPLGKGLLDQRPLGVGDRVTDPAQLALLVQLAVLRCVRGGLDRVGDRGAARSIGGVDNPRVQRLDHAGDRVADVARDAGLSDRIQVLRVLLKVTGHRILKDRGLARGHADGGVALDAKLAQRTLALLLPQPDHRVKDRVLGRVGVVGDAPLLHVLRMALGAALLGARKDQLLGLSRLKKRRVL